MRNVPGRKACTRNVTDTNSPFEKSLKKFRISSVKIWTVSNNKKFCIFSDLFRFTKCFGRNGHLEVIQLSTECVG